MEQKRNKCEINCRKKENKSGIKRNNSGIILLTLVFQTKSRFNHRHDNLYHETFT